MSTLLVMNDGRQDCNIYAQQLLEEVVERCRRELNDLPSIRLIQQTHFIPYHYKFKPLVACSLEYHKINPNSTAQFDQTLSFSISQYGDFISDMAVHLQLGECSTNKVTIDKQLHLPVNRVINQDVLNTDEKLISHITSASSVDQGVYDLVIDASNKISTQFKRYTLDGQHLTVRQLLYKGLQDSSQKLFKIGDTAQDHIAYCDYPGERLFETVCFEINGNKLDEYNDYSYVFNREFKMKSDTKEAYKRAVGHKTFKESVGASNGNQFRYRQQYEDGLQVPKPSQPKWQMWQKLLFWFNRDVCLALPSCAIPYGQRFIRIKLAPKEKIIHSTAALWHVYEKVERIFNVADKFKIFPATGGIADSSLAISDVFTISNDDVTVGNLTADPINLPNTIQTNIQALFVPQKLNSMIHYPEIQKATLYANNIFTHSVLHDIYVHTIGYTIVRIHRLFKKSMSVSNDRMRLDSFKFPVEQIYAGIVMDENVDTNREESASSWHHFTKNSYNYNFDNVLTGTSNLVVSVPGDSTMPGLGIHSHNLIQGMINGPMSKYSTNTTTISTLGIEAHGIDIFNKELSEPFYNSYLPMIANQSGNGSIVTPELPGSILINFALNPGDLQPSGHINISRAREFYINIDSEIISSKFPGTLYAEACAINFLLVSDGSAVLRYST